MRIKIICLNLWLGGKLIDPILEFIKKENPDVLAVQEAYDSKNEKLERRFRSMEVILKACGFEYCFFSPACIAVFPDKKVPAGNAIFSKFPIIDTDEKFIYSSFSEVENYEEQSAGFSFPRNLQHAVIDVGSKKINIFNVQGIWRNNNEDSEERIKMSNVIVEEAKNKDNIILCGDFNITPKTKTIKNIEKNLKNVFGDKLKSTFNMKQKENGIYSELVVDMIFCSDNLRITDRYCPNVNISDHLPLVIKTEV
jgi:endonuclease/exonuclease/phosphatase family metal-dependent hydrolase